MAVIGLLIVVSILSSLGISSVELPLQDYHVVIERSLAEWPDEPLGLGSSIDHAHVWCIPGIVRAYVLPLDLVL